jgi:hypothetical protein
MLTQVIEFKSNKWNEIAGGEFSTTEDIINEVIKDLERREGDKYIFHDHIGNNFVIVDILKDKPNKVKIITKNELEGLRFF